MLAGTTSRPVQPGKREQFHLRDVPSPADAAATWVGQWLDKPTLFGDWFGLRSALERLGIVPTITCVTDVQGNPIGGQQQALREFDTLYVEVDVALEKLLGAPGTAFHLGLSQRSGRSLSDIDIGNVFNVAQTCCGATFFLVDVYLEQPFFDDRLNVRVGRIAMGDEFLTSPLYWLFVQSAIDGNPSGIFFNAPGASVYPQATWGLRVRVEPVPQVYAMLGLFNGDPTLGRQRQARRGLEHARPALRDRGDRLSAQPGAEELRDCRATTRSARTTTAGPSPTSCAMSRAAWRR